MLELRSDVSLERCAVLVRALSKSVFCSGVWGGSLHFVLVTFPDFIIWLECESCHQGSLQDKGSLTHLASVLTVLPHLLPVWGHEALPPRD